MKTDEWEAIFSNKDDPRSKLIEDYGASVVAYDLKYKTIRLAAQLKANGALEAANRVLGQFKSLKATLDMSYPRQLAGLLFIDPKGSSIGANNFFGIFSITRIHIVIFFLVRY